MLPSAYLVNQKVSSYSSSELANNKVYLTQASNSLLYPNLLSGGSVTAQELVEHETGASGEMVFIPPNTGPNEVEQICTQLNVDPGYSDRDMVIADCNCSEPISQYHGLSLSLGSQESSLVHFHSDFNHYSDTGLGSLIGQNMQSGIQHSQDSNVQNVQYLSFDSGKASVNNRTNLVSSKETSFMSASTDIFGNSKYLKAAQDLLDEILSVHRDSKWSEKAKNLNHLTPQGSSWLNVNRDGVSAEHLESKSVSLDLPVSESNDLQNKLTKLSSMLGEVDSRYRQYCHQMQIVVSSFDTFAGHGAALPYTALALKAISQKFRLLRDAIKKQIQASQKSLGEQDDNSNGPGVLSRLRFVDQQLRQQMGVVQQFGVLRQPWRPQRGLPETAVSILRAWLFEHFLHPYPKDSEKIALARQTGLSRSQVANWFINARVRLWKPMIEEIYNEEFGDDGTQPKSSPENTTANQEMPSFYNMEEKFHGDESRVYQGYNNEANVGLTETLNNYMVNVASNGNAPEDNASSVSKTINDMNTSHIFLALGLQQSEKDSSNTNAMTVEAQAKDVSCPVVERLEYYYDDPVNNQNQFANSHLLSDFVTRDVFCGSKCKDTKSFHQ